jgi:hypothetical protein
VSAPRSLVGEKRLRNSSNQPLSHRNARSWARSWDDGGDFRSYTIRDDQVGFYVIMLKLKAHHFVRRTKLIDDAKRPVPQYRGLIHGTTEIVKAEGLRGVYRGLFPVVRSVRVTLDQPAHETTSDDAARRQLRRTIHHVFHPQAILSGCH